MPPPLMPQPKSPQGNSQWSWGGLLDPLATKTTYQAPPTPPPAPAYHIPDRGITVNDNDLQQLNRVAFGEASNNNDPQEIRHITNTVLNRMKNYGMSMSDVLSAPHQYQAYGGPQYTKAQNPSAMDPLSQKKYNFVTSITNEIKNGSFPDTTNGSESYTHKGDKLILNSNKWKPSRSGRTYQDLIKK
jgi:hypothetical protein